MASQITEEIVPLAEQAMHRLKSSNERFLCSTSLFPGVWKGLLTVLAKGQNPYAAVLSCSDSRVPPELIFDAGFGDLFVVRVAGHVLSPEVSGSIQYADAKLNTPLLVVLGHEDCGAVRAAVEAKWHGVRPLPRIKILVDEIIPALADVDPMLPARELLSRAVEANVRWTIRQILESRAGQTCPAEDRMKLVGAVYDIESGRVNFLT